MSQSRKNTTISDSSIEAMQEAFDEIKRSNKEWDDMFDQTGADDHSSLDADLFADAQDSDTEEADDKCFEPDDLETVYAQYPFFDSTKTDVLPVSAKDIGAFEQDWQKIRRHEERKALFKANHLTQSKRRNSLTLPPHHILYETQNYELREFANQVIYLLASKSLQCGILKRIEINNNELVMCDETILLSALFGLSSVMHKIAAAAGKSPLELKFAPAVIEQRRQLLEQLERRTYALDSKAGTKSWFHYAQSLKNQINLEPNASALLYFIIRQPDPSVMAFEFDYENLAALFRGRLILDFPSEQLEQLLRLNAAKPSLLAQHRKVSQLKQYCQQRIFGQEEAVASIGEMVAASLSVKKAGCMGIATFMGASGSGKTALAESLTQAVNTEFGAGYHTLVLNMEMFSEQNSVMKLFGSGSQYVDSSLGDLTTEIICFPRTVIVLDEIEKAHTSVIQAMLTLLEKGQIKDQTTNNLVDFSQCFFIFTTNLGQKASAQALTDSKMLDLKALLAAKPGQPGLSPELISRLAGGYIALFKPLSAQNLLAVAEQAADIALADQGFQWPQNMAELILETLGGNLEPRSIKAQPAKLKSLIMRHICQAVEEADTDPAISVTITEDITDFHFAVLTQQPRLKRLFKAHFNHCTVVSSTSRLKALASNSKLSALLLPCDATAETLSAAQATRLPIYGFNASAVIYPLYTPPVCVEKVYQLAELSQAAMTQLVQQMAKRQRLLNTMVQWRARNMTVSFDYQLDVKPERIAVTLTDPVYEQRFRHEDFEPGFMQTPCVPDTSFKDLIGLDALKQQMGFILQTLRGHNNFVLDMPKGYLLAGLPGTGKSYFAKAVAGECQVPFIPVNAADMMCGNVVDNINHLFDVAERYAPCIVFFDEFDAVALNRQTSSTLGRLAVNTLLTRLDGFNQSQNPVFVLAATNFARSLDPAIMRHGRFDKVVNIPLPDIQARTRFIKNCAAQYQFDIPVKALQQFARKISGATFGFIANLFRDMQLTILTEQKPFNVAMLDEQLLTATIGNKKAVSTTSAKTRLIIAYHETGHYLLNKRWFPNARCTSLSIQEHEGAGGVTAFDYDEEDTTNTRATIKARLQILLAGRAAEKLLSKDKDDITTGASHDIQQATKLARMAISDCGFSDVLGLADFKQLPMLQQNVEQEVLKWLNEAYAESEAYLQQNWALVKSIAEELFEKEVLDQETLDLVHTKHLTRQNLKSLG
ncbi:AAA family ATPase [Rheinheimera sp. D18]|uniref:AAA family ATPase n=1 Tax=Rheinheimera sp. D18 TaxID=2545632 RepID=UPI00104EA656|nr:AAA family ATPase [Rheinheimera sp. D18]QBL10421.1 AAA family ATPase [Rheinheimera sp. D18]